MTKHSWLVAATMAVTAVIVLGIYLLYGSLENKDSQSFLTTTLERADLEDAILVLGVVNATNTVNIGAQVNGQIKVIHVTAGDQVKRGQLLIEIDPVLQLNELKRAEANLFNALAQETQNRQSLQFKQNTLARHQALREALVNTSAELEQAKNEFESEKIQLTIAQSRVAQAHIEVDTARANLAYTTIKAPSDGDILHVMAQTGQTIVSAQASPAMLVMGSLNTMTVKARVSEADVVRVRLGQEAYFNMPGVPAHRFKGTIKAIEVIPESALPDVAMRGRGQLTGGTPIYYNALFNVNNPDHMLRPEMTVKVRIVQNVVRNVLVLPSNALRGVDKDRLQASVCVLLPDGSVNLRTVEIGLSDVLRVEIKKGLIEGENVILQSENDNTDCPNT